MSERELAIVVVAKGISKATGQILTLDRKLQHLGKATRNASANLQRGIVVAATAAAGGIFYAARAATEWESAFAGVRKTVEGTPAELDAIAESIRAMSREIPISAIELAAIAENAGALGIAKADIVEFTRTVALIGTTTNVSTDDAATALGQLQNVLGLTGADFDNFGAALVDLGNKGASTEAQILEIARRAGGAIQLFGIAKDETLGWAAAAANLGMQEELAGTSLQRMFLALLPKYSAGAKDLREITGLTARQLKQSWEKDASGSVEFLIQKIASMPKDARLSAVQDLFGKGTGLTRLVLGLADSYERNLKPALDNSTSAWAENNALTEEARKRFETAQSAFTVFKNNVQDAAVTIGSALLPQLAALAKEGSTWIGQHQPEIKQFAADLAQGLRDAVTWLKGLDWNAIAGTLGAAAGFAKTMVEWFLKLPGPIQQFLAVGFAANKFTGGVIGDIVGDLAKGAIKGVLGIRAGHVTVVGGTVAGGAPGVAPVGKVGGALALVSNVMIVGFAAGIAEQLWPPVRDLARTLHEQSPFKDIDLDASQLQWPLGPKNAPDWARMTPAPSKLSGTLDRPKVGGMSPDERQEHNDTQARLDALNQKAAAQRNAAERTKASVDWSRMSAVSNTNRVVAAIRSINLDVRVPVTVNVAGRTLYTSTTRTGQTLVRTGVGGQALL